MTLAQAPRHSATDDNAFEDESIVGEGVGEAHQPQAPSGRRLGRGLITAVALVGVLLTGVVVGGFVFLNTSPAVRPPAVDLSPDDVSSAQDSVSSAKMMIDMMSATVDSGTSGIEKVVSSIDPTFASIDTAAKAADQMVTGLEQAPNLRDAATEIQELGTSVSRSLTEAQSLAGSARDIDELVTPIIDGLSRSDVPGADKTISRLESLRTAALEISAQFGDLRSLRTELDRATAATGPAAREIDGAVTQARTAASQLKDGLDKLASARTDTEKAADSMSAGLDKLKSALASVSDNLSSADESLTTDDAQPAYVYDHANRIGRGVTAGAVTALILVVAAGGLWIVVRRRSR